MILAHRIALDPTDRQRTYFAKACGVARFAWNWGLTEWKRQYGSGGKPSEQSLRRQLNSIKGSQFPWMLEVTKCAPQESIRHLGVAFQSFFAKRTHFPRFKKKGTHDAFEVSATNYKIQGKRILIPRLGWVRMREPLRFVGRTFSATISRSADRWFVIVSVEVATAPSPREKQAAIGVDLGISVLATLSNGTKVVGPKPHQQKLASLRRLSRSLSRKVKGSANRHKAKQRVARLYRQLSNIRSDALHKLTTSLCRDFTHIGIESLNVMGMRSKRSLSRAVSDMGFHEFRRQLGYKAERFGAMVVVADQWEPTSKRCSDCGIVGGPLPLSVRHWTCANCGTQHDRDVNAAKNLERIAAGHAVTACGAEGSGRGLVLATTKPAATKQEPNARNFIGIAG
jgi:putative transposase